MKKKLIIIGICLILALNATVIYGDGITKFSWYLTDDVVSTTVAFNPISLPDSLVNTPGVYTYNGQTYDMTKEGLYRFFEVNGVNRQCIIYQNDTHKLLSSLAWITTHGNSDNTKTYAELKTAAKSRKINVTCGKVIGLAKDILTGVQTRQVSLYALDNINGFDDGHVLLEVYRTDLNKWVLYDLDNNFVFADANGNLLSLWEVLSMVNTDEYKMKAIANDANIDITNTIYPTGDYGIYNETTLSDKYKWLKRNFAFPTIYENGVYYGIDSTRTRDLAAADTTYLTGLGINYQVLPETEFLTRFYNQ